MNQTELMTNLKRIAEIKQILETNKPLYDEMDNIVSRIAKGGLGSGTSQRVDNMVFTMIDNFDSKNTVFRPCGVKRFEIMVETQDEYLETLAKAAKKAAKAAKEMQS
jgi:hypothetical protein